MIRPKPPKFQEIADFLQQAQTATASNQRLPRLARKPIVVGQEVKESTKTAVDGRLGATIRAQDHGEGWLKRADFSHSRADDRATGFDGSTLMAGPETDLRPW